MKMKKLHKIEVDRLEDKFICVNFKDIEYFTIVTTDQDMFIIKLCLYYCVIFFGYNIIFYHPSPGISMLNCYNYSCGNIGHNELIGFASYGCLSRLYLIK